MPSFGRGMRENIQIITVTKMRCWKESTCLWEYFSIMVINKASQPIQNVLTMLLSEPFERGSYGVNICGGTDYASKEPNAFLWHFCPDLIVGEWIVICSHAHILGLKARSLGKHAIYKVHGLSQLDIPSCLRVTYHISDIKSPLRQQDPWPCRPL